MFARRTQAGETKVNSIEELIGGQIALVATVQENPDQVVGDVSRFGPEVRRDDAGQLIRRVGRAASAAAGSVSRMRGETRALRCS